MKAAFLTDLRQIEVRDTKEPQLKDARNALLRVDAVGVCGSDVHYYTAGRIGSAVVDFPFIMGHECAATVLEVGAEVGRLRPGQRVAIDPLISCGQCDQCRAGRAHTCRNQRFLGMPGECGGALAEYLVLPEECCYPVPDRMTTEEAVLVEPLSIAVYAQQLSQVDDGARIAILGAGPIGLSVLLACCAAADCRVYVTDLIAERLELASRLGAAWTGNPTQGDVVNAIRGADALGVDVVFECAGKQETLDQAIELLKPGGTLLIVGIPETDRLSFPIHALRRKELAIKNVRRQNRCTALTIDLLASGRISVAPLVTHHFSLSAAQAAFDLVAGYGDGVVKALIHVPDQP